MRASVLAAFHRFSEPLEGRVPFFYLDNAEPEGLVTIGVGNLVDPIGEALSLPLVWPDGRRASREEIEADWRRVKVRQDIKAHGGMSFRTVARLRLPSEEIDALVERKLRSVDAQLARLFPAWAEWPTDAQLALLSWAWAVGAAARYPRMLEHLRAGRFAELTPAEDPPHELVLTGGAAFECTINPQRGTIIERNKRNRTLLSNAEFVVSRGLDPDVLYWPRSLAAEKEPMGPYRAEPEPAIVHPPVLLGDD